MEQKSLHEIHEESTKLLFVAQPTLSLTAGGGRTLLITDLVSSDTVPQLAKTLPFPRASPATQSSHHAPP